MRHNDKVYYAYVDGSARIKRERYGIGGIIFNQKSAKRGSTFSLEIHGKQSSVSAEIRAAAFALNDIPAHSVVMLHSDFQTVVRKINKDKILEWGEKTKKSLPLQNAYTDLFNAVARHEKVTAIHMRKKKSDFIRIAHNLAKAASSGMTARLYEEFQKAHNHADAADWAPKGNRRQRKLRAIADSIKAYGLIVPDMVETPETALYIS